MNLEITEVTLADKKDIVTLFNAEKVTWPWGLGVPFWRYFNGRGRTERWHKAVLDGRVVGSIHWAIRIDNTRTIHDVVTHPSVRGKGVGRALVNFIGTPITLKTDVGAPSNDFYLHLGFIKGETAQTRDGKKFVTSYYLPREFQPMPDGPWILTYTGLKLNPLRLQSHEVRVEDIAHALACVNRFAGHSAKPITVAQHSVYVSRLCGEGTPQALQALFHDASEAYLGDVTKWLKESEEFVGYRAAELIAQNAIYDRFGCARDLDPIVERADRVMVMYEGEQGFGTAWENGRHLPYAPITEAESALIGDWAPRPWRESEIIFLARYRALTGK